MMLHRHFEEQRNINNAKKDGGKAAPEKFVSAIFPPIEDETEKPVEQTKRRGRSKKNDG